MSGVRANKIDSSANDRYLVRVTETTAHHEI